MVMADEQDDTPFGQKMWERIVDREREELRTKRAGSNSNLVFPPQSRLEQCSILE